MINNIEIKYSKKIKAIIKVIVIIIIMFIAYYSIIIIYFNCKPMISYFLINVIVISAIIILHNFHFVNIIIRCFSLKLIKHYLFFFNIMNFILWIIYYIILLYKFLFNFYDNTF
jgi:hypothetical protein